MTTKTMPNAKPAVSDSDNPKRKYERKANVPLTVYDVRNDGKSIALFRVKEQADAFASQAADLAASMGGKVGNVTVVERKCN